MVKVIVHDIGDSSSVKQVTVCGYHDIYVVSHNNNGIYVGQTMGAVLMPSYEHNGDTQHTSNKVIRRHPGGDVYVEMYINE